MGDVRECVPRAGPTVPWGQSLNQKPLHVAPSVNMMQVSPSCGGVSDAQTRGHAMENTQNNEVVLEEALIEEVSIDGMCGVY